MFWKQSLSGVVWDRLVVVMRTHSYKLESYQFCSAVIGDSYFKFEMETRHMTSGFPSLLFSQSPIRRLRVYRPHLVFLHCSFSKLCCPAFSLLRWFMANESGMREYVRGGMGTFGEMAVSGQTTSRQVGKWSEVLLLLFFHYRGICISPLLWTQAINCL